MSAKDWELERRTKKPLKLVKTPIVRQYFHKGLLWRASVAEEVASFELFVDLLYVGIIAINGDRASEDATGLSLLRFCITFILSWKIWSDLTLVVSWFETGGLIST
jgi:low temperature requirement protein LtrA